MARSDGVVPARHGGGRDASAEGRPVREGDTPPQPYRDEFAYLGDMIAEMSAMASRLGSPTLAGILDIAHREAALERERRT